MQTISIGSTTTPTLLEFKERYEAALEVRYNSFLKVKEFEDSYPDYEYVFPFNYYEKRRKDKASFMASFENQDWKAKNFIMAFNEGDFGKCLENIDF